MRVRVRLQPPMPSPRLAFVLNFDAEHELALGARWTAPRALASHLFALARAMPLPEGAVLVTPGEPIPAGCEGRLWCPTPRSLAALTAAGASLPETPSLDVVRRVNERAFASELARGELEPTLASIDLQALEVFLLGPSPTGRWRLKRGLGASGRGQRTVTSGTLSAPDRGWLARSVSLGAVYVEPAIEIEREVALYGWVHREGGVSLTGTRGQTVDARGSFVRCGRIEHASLGEHARAFGEAAERVGEALHASGYFGPFGIDGYLHRSAGGALHLRALSEINARYCMGWDERDGF